MSMTGSLVFADEEKENFLYCIPANVDIKNGNVSLSEQNFNRHWKKLKRSVKRGMDSAKVTGNPSGEEKPEDIVVLDNLIRQNSIPCIRKDVIQYESRPLSAEKLCRQSRRRIDLRKACAPHTKQIQISLVCGTIIT